MVNNRLLIVAASGKVAERARVFHLKLAQTLSAERRRGEVQS